MLIAKQYVSVNGTLYIKGEEIPKSELSGERLVRMLEKGAVEETASFLQGITDEDEDAVEVEDEIDEAEDGIDEALPEIDVTSGIVSETKTKRGKRK